MLHGDDGLLSKVQVNGGMQPGNSGGPVVDPHGNVIGVAVSIIEGTQINFPHIHVDLVYDPVTQSRNLLRKLCPMGPTVSGFKPC